VSGTFSSSPGRAGGGDDRRPRDPVSWLQIEQGWNVVTSDDVVVGTVAQIEGDKHDDIFDGLAVESGKQVRYVPGEKVGLIFAGTVTLTLGSGDLETLEPFRASQPETKWAPGKASLSARLSRWLGGKR
jgi:hypothetical protein